VRGVCAQRGCGQRKGHPLGHPLGLYTGLLWALARGWSLPWPLAAPGCVSRVVTVAWTAFPRLVELPTPTHHLCVSLWISPRTGSLNFGAAVPGALLVFVVGLSYSSLNPIISPFACIYFFLGMLVYRHNVYVRWNEGGTVGEGG
jgi:hypothetical protein